jgi:phospholipase C
VPALIISPYVKPGQIDPTIYDHTSAIATAMKLFAPQAWPSDVLGKRAQAANTFETVLDLTMQPRMDVPNFAAPPAAPAVVGDLAAAAAPRPLSSLQRDAVAHAAQLEQRLPPQLQTRTDVSTIKDENAAGAYLKQVSTNLKTYSDGVRSNANK